jgi:hypothetical protein
MEWMKSATSTDTDGRVVDMMRTLGVKVHRVIRDGLLLGRIVWSKALSRVDLPEHLRYLYDVQLLLRELRKASKRTDAHMRQRLDDILAAKDLYWHGQEDLLPDNVCAVLTCRRPGGSRAGGSTMNSRYYCTQHRGLAVFNGLRHHNYACMFWSMVGLKGDAGTGGHTHHLWARYQPVTGKGQTQTPLVRIRRHCTRRLRERLTPVDLRFYPAGELRYASLRKTKRTLLPVPEGSWIHISGTTGLVDAWIQAELWDFGSGTWQPATSTEELDRALQLAGLESDICTGKAARPTSDGSKAPVVPRRAQIASQKHVRRLAPTRPGRATPPADPRRHETNPGWNLGNGWGNGSEQGGWGNDAPAEGGWGNDAPAEGGDRD